MAQNSVNVTQNLQAKPSIFELVAADSFQSTFYPALKRVAHFLVNLNPSKYGWLSQYYDEVYLCLNAIIQQHYIRCYGGSLAEVFYSLSRVRSKNEQFSSLDKFLAFALVTIAPYISAKVTNTINQWKDDCDHTVMEAKEFKRKQLCIRIYKIGKGIYDFFQLLQYVGYLSDRSSTHSILNRAIGQHLVYLSAETNLDWSWSDLFSLNFRNSAVLTGMVFRALELSAFFLQFVQWWQDETTHGSLTKLPNPEPPRPTSGAAERYRKICPICLQSWRIPTVNRVSGFVYCFKCIVKYLGANGHCPVTEYPTSINDLIRIYDLE